MSFLPVGEVVARHFSPSSYRRRPFFWVPFFISQVAVTWENYPKKKEKNQTPSPRTWSRSPRWLDSSVELRRCLFYGVMDSDIFVIEGSRRWKRCRHPRPGRSRGGGFGVAIGDDASTDEDATFDFKYLKPPLRRRLTDPRRVLIARRRSQRWI